MRNNTDKASPEAQPSVKGDSFNWHPFFGVNDNVTPSSTSTAYLALNLGIVSMGSIQFPHVTNTFAKKKNRVKVGTKGAHLKLCFRAPNFQWFKGVYYLSVRRASQNWSIKVYNKFTLLRVRTCTGVFRLCMYL